MKATIANRAWQALSWPAWLRFRRALLEPERTQRSILASLLRRNAKSQYGRVHGFDSIDTYERFRERVPIVSYDDLQPWMQRILRGEPGILTREPVIRLVPTSGSSGGRKLIPYTAGFQSELNSAVGPWVFDLAQHYPEFARGSAYWSISPLGAFPENEKSIVPIGFDEDSGYLGKARRRLVNWSAAVPGEARLVRDVEAWRYLTILCLLRKRDLRFISIWHPSFLAVFFDRMADWWPDLLKDIESGGCRDVMALPWPTRRALRAASQPKRARELKKKGPFDIQGLWPRLQLVSCWGDGQTALALQDLQRRLRGVTIQPKGLLATEAIVSIPFQSRHPVAVTSHFLEFLDDSGRVRLAHELRDGEVYSVIVTTAAGLWRYRLGDRVQVTGFVSAVPSLQFLGRGSEVSDLCGEKLSESFVAGAIATVCASFHFVPRFAMLAPEMDSMGSANYTLFIDRSSPERLSADLDQALRANPHYATCRDLGQLGPLRCCQADADAYEIFCLSGTKQGCRLGDIKPRALSASLDWRTRLRLPEGMAAPAAGFDQKRNAA